MKPGDPLPERSRPPVDLDTEPEGSVDALADELFRGVPSAKADGGATRAWHRWLGTAPSLAIDDSCASSGRRCGGHELVERIGQGAFGIVYRARRPAPADGYVAVKILKGRFVGSHLARLFEREVALAARLDDPRAVRVLGGGVEDGRPYLVSELVENATSITAHCDRRCLGLRERVALLVDVARGVAHAHQRAVIHRDLKPGNILVQQIGGSGAARVRVVDFGMARAIAESAAGDSARSLDGWLLGTPAYMAPEQARGSRDIDVRADVYALGVVLFEVLTGSLPWHDDARLRDDMVAQLLAVDSGPAPLPSLRLASRGAAATRPYQAAALQGELDWIVARAMASSPVDRYPDAATLAADLERFLDGRPVLAGPRGGAYGFRCWMRRHRTMAGGLLAAAALLVLAFGVVLVSAWSAARARIDRVTERDAAIRHLRRFDLLAEEVRLRRAEQVAETLYPASPERVPELAAWLAEHGDPIRRGRPALAAAVAAERSCLESSDATALPDLLREGERILADVDRFLATGACFRVEEQIARWSRPPRLPDDAWSRAAAGLAADARFVGVSLAPQPDLAPLGPDPVTGLQEFAHWLSGDVPRRGADGRLQLTSNAGIVLVLLPAGAFSLGEQSDDPAAPNYCRDALPGAAFPVVDAAVAPFFMGKHEVTRSQWARMGGAMTPQDASEHVAGVGYDDEHPIGDVDWWSSDLVLRRHGLALPSVVQWEYAARAGTRTPWWCGDDPAEAERIANFADRSMRLAAESIPGAHNASGFDDGHPGMAPVGRFPANPFGLHDVLGNVAEWCGDLHASHWIPARTGDGARFGPFAPSWPLVLMPIRGGGFEDRARNSAAGRRHCDSPSHSRPGVGLRASRPLAPSPPLPSGR